MSERDEPIARMAHADLNPTRTAMVTTPEQSDYTSIQERIECPESVGKQLHVAHVLEGSVRRAGDSICVNAQL